jgi:hypothetical protein
LVALCSRCLIQAEKKFSGEISQPAAEELVAAFRIFTFVALNVSSWSS